MTNPKINDRDVTSLSTEVSKPNSVFEPNHPMSELKMEDLLETQKVLTSVMYNDEFWERIMSDPSMVIHKKN